MQGAVFSMISSLMHVILPFLTVFMIGFIFFIMITDYVNASSTADEDNGPIINDARFKVELIYKGIKYGTNMAILNPEDILVLERFEGTVQRIVNGQMLEEPVLDVNVSSQDGMLGIAVTKKTERASLSSSQSNSNGNTTDVFLYYTESQNEDGGEGLGNRLYKYVLGNDGLEYPDLLVDLPASPGRMHHGGEILVGPDSNIYLVIGEVGATGKIDSKAINVKNGLDPDGRSGILRITQDGEIVKPSILGDEHPLDMYYAYGIRNSFGLDFDPLTGNLWDTENGPEYGDEINLVEPGFNSGWEVVQGMMKDPQDLNLLEDFGGKGKYSDPEFVWEERAGPTAIKFLDSNRLGKRYENSIFVGDVHTGNIYNFGLNKERTKLRLEGPPEEKVANDDHDIPDQEVEDTIFGRNFGSVVDLDVGPDGLLYIVSISPGKIFKILPVE
jgi:glucose/arabinose dehydrogenase